MMKRRDILQRKGHITISETKEITDWSMKKKCGNKKGSQKLKVTQANPGRLLKIYWTGKNLKPQQSFFYTGTLGTKSQNIVNSQNKSFISKIVNIKKEIGQPRSDPLKVLKSLMSNSKCQMKFSPTHPDEVEKIISNNQTHLQVDRYLCFKIS